MHIRTDRRPAAPAFAAAATVAVLLAGCGENGGGGDDPAGSGRPAPPPDAELAALVPEEVSADGRLTAAVNATYPPNEYLAEDGETVEGWDVELFEAVAATLGLEVEWVPAPFGAIIPGVQSGEYELGVSSFTVNGERTAAVTMVSYFNAGTQWAAPAGAPVDPDDACGARVAVQRDTVQVEDVTARSQRCVDEGRPEITVEQFQGQELATASVVSGQNDAMLADSPVCAYAVAQTGGALELVGDIYDAAPYGYVIHPDRADLADAVHAALAAVMDDGTYEQILTAWGVEGGALTDPAVAP